MRAGHRGRSIARTLIAGAADYAVAEAAPAVAGYPVDNRGERVERTMAYVGTRSMFEGAGFTLAATTDAVSDGFPRIVVRRPRLA